MKFEAYSDKTKGVKIDGNWYHASQAVQGFIRNIPFNSEVEAKLEGEGKDVEVTFLKVLGRPQGQQPIERTFTPAGDFDDGKTRSMSLSYCKDLVAAGKIPLNQIFTYADAFFKYMKEGKGGELIIEDTVK